MNSSQEKFSKQRVVFSKMDAISYVGKVKQPINESSEFLISTSDFPALPGTECNRIGPSQLRSNLFSENKQYFENCNSALKSDVLSANNTLDKEKSEKSQSTTQGIQVFPDGRITNIPASMIKDQFGIAGLLMLTRSAEKDPNLVSLALGQELTELGLDINSPNSLYPNFGGPWAKVPCRPQDIDYHVPPEYLVNSEIKDKLANIKLNRYSDDLLFFFFYTSIKDIMQLVAAAKLYSRGWRYHMEEKMWITQAPGVTPTEKTSTYERGIYLYFDARSWRKVPKELHLEYVKLEGKPDLPIPTNLYRSQH